MRIFTLVSTVLLAAAPAFAHEFKVGDLVVDHPVALETAQTARAGAGYLVITNNGDTSDRLIGVEADFPRVMIHDTKIEDDVASMFHVDSIEIAPGESVTFMPRGKHVMFMGLENGPLVAGESFPSTLVFENAGRLEITFNVETRETFMEGREEADAEVDHSAHGDDADKHDDHSGH